MVMVVLDFVAHQLNRVLRWWPHVFHLTWGGQIGGGKIRQYQLYVLFLLR
jgi:hypothetical protein